MGKKEEEEVVAKKRKKNLSLSQKVWTLSSVDVSPPLLLKSRNAVIKGRPSTFHVLIAFESFYVITKRH